MRMGQKGRKGWGRVTRVGGKQESAGVEGGL